MLFPYEKNFNQWCSSQNLAPRTITSINQSIYYFWNYFLQNSNSEPTVGNVSAQDIRAFIDHLEQDQNKTISTINKYVTHLKKYFSFLICKYILLLRKKAKQYYLYNRNKFF